MLLGLLVCMPFGHVQPAAAETNANIQDVASSGQVFITEVSDMVLVGASAQHVETSPAACAVEAVSDVALVQQTANVEALLVCNNLTFGHVAEVATLPVVAGPVESAGVVVAAPIREFAAPTLAPWNAGTQPTALVVSADLAPFREVIVNQPRTACIALFTHGTSNENVKSLAELGCMLC